ncbi:hypothetical protein M885DRAFT_524938 [Pelagophyceae sp. CCMP2097]|nr:hypothetical protein M885DRAFT_524938 [Pelagophyceae sp. CCMP2097]
MHFPKRTRRKCHSSTEPAAVHPDPEDHLEGPPPRRAVSPARGPFCPTALKRPFRQGPLDEPPPWSASRRGLKRRLARPLNPLARPLNPKRGPVEPPFRTAAPLWPPPCQGHCQGAIGPTCQRGPTSQRSKWGPSPMPASSPPAASREQTKGAVLRQSI